MKRVHDATIPYAGGFDEAAFKNHAGVHLRGTGSPWQKVANVYIAGHRLGYMGTASWLGFWDLNNVETGDKVFVTDSMGRRYVYRVFKEFIVDPEAIHVTQPSRARTCSPSRPARCPTTRGALSSRPRGWKGRSHR